MSTRVHEAGVNPARRGTLGKKKRKRMNCEVYRNAASENGLIKCVDKPQRVRIGCTAAAFCEQCAADFFSDGARL